MFKINYDALGISASIACAIHCALLPLIFSSLPIFGINIINNEAFEYFMILMAAVIGWYSLTHGFKRHHHKRLPLSLFMMGIAMLFIKQAWHEYQYALLAPAVTLIVVAHYLNYKYCRDADHCHSSDCSH
jgi:MerC mercury resistance protein